MTTGAAAAFLAAALALGACGRDAATRDAAATVRFEVSDPAAAPAAASVLRTRLQALGLAPADVRVEGAVVTFGTSRALTAEERSLVARPGRVAFRPVLAALAPDAAVPGTPAGSCADEAYRQGLAGDAATAAGNADVVACAADGDAKYRLGATEATGRDVRSAEAQRAAGGTGGTAASWVVSLTMASAADWLALTETYIGRQLAILADGVVLTAPTVNERLPGGAAEISGSFTEVSAKTLAAALRSGVLEVPVEARD